MPEPAPVITELRVEGGGVYLPAGTVTDIRIEGRLTVIPAGEASVHPCPPPNATDSRG